MAIAFGNTGTLAYANWTAIASASSGLIQQVGAPGWSRAMADITPISANNDILRHKLFSRRLDGKPISVTMFYDAASGGLGAPPFDVNALTLAFPTGNSDFVQNCAVTDFNIGQMIDDEVMLSECEFTPEGNEAFDDPTAA